MNKVMWAAAIIFVFQIIISTSSKAQTSSEPGSMKNGFTALCVNVKGVDYRLGEWGKDGYSGQAFKIIYKGGVRFQETESLFPYTVMFVSDVAIVGIGTWKSSAYLMSLNRKRKEMMMSRLVEGALGSLFVGTCDFIF
jgi:hypothetical protein